MVRYEVNAYDFHSGLKEIHWHIRKSWNHGIVYDGEKMTARVQMVGPSQITRNCCCNCTRLRRGHVHLINNKYLGELHKRFWVINLAISSSTPSLDIVLSIQFCLYFACLSLLIHFHDICSLLW